VQIADITTHPQSTTNVFIEETQARSQIKEGEIYSENATTLSLSPLGSLGVSLLLLTLSICNLMFLK